MQFFYLEKAHYLSPLQGEAICFRVQPFFQKGWPPEANSSVSGHSSVSGKPERQRLTSQPPHSTNVKPVLS